MKKILGVVAVLIAVGLWITYQRERGIQPGEFKNFNVVLITLDTTRADHLPMYGYKNVKTPNLDRLARESYIFEDAISHVPLTLPAHTSILTGMLPIEHGVRDNAGFFVDRNLRTLPEVLKANGYQTSAFVSSFVLDSQWQLNQGFDFYYDHFNFNAVQTLTPDDAQRRAEETAIEAEHWLDKNAGKRFFCWVHFYDPHEPYNPPEPFKTEYASRPYDGEIAYMDSAIGRLLDKLSSSGLEKNTILVVTGDHGEGLGEHKEDTHAMFVYDATQRVPLLIYVPGKRGIRVGALARHIDLFPTIVDLLGINAEQKSQPGSSLVALMKGPEEPDRTAYVESMYPELHYGWSPLSGVVTNRFKYIAAPKPELYDRIQDPKEVHNLIHEQADTAKMLKGQLDKITAGKSTSGEPQPLDQETEERLRSLGYVGSRAVSTKQSRKVDPKDRIHLARALHLATAEAHAKRYEAAIQLLLPVLHEDPQIADAHFMAGVSYIGLGKPDDAIQEFTETLSMRPRHTMSLYNLGLAYQVKGDQQAALECYLAVLKQEPEHLYANTKVAHIYLARNQPEQASPYFLRTIARYERDLQASRSAALKSALHANLGEAYFGAGDLPQAETHIKAAIQLSPEKSDLHYNLGSIHEARGDIDAAMKAYQRETELNPQNYDAFNNLGLLYQRNGKFGQAALCFQRIIQLLPGQPRGYLLLASVYKQMGKTEEANRLLRKVEKGL